MKLESDKFSPEKEQYYVEITDMHGNKSLYSLIKKEGHLFMYNYVNNKIYERKFP